MKRLNGRVSAKVSLERVKTTRGLSYKGNALRKIAMQSMFAMAFVFLCASAWGQAKVSYSDAESPVLEVRGVEDASVNVIPVERTSPNGKQLYCAYDIDIIKDGREWQPEPEKPAMVTMENPDFADGQLLDIYHEGANGLEFVATVAANDGKITFPAHSFSVYIVTQAGDYARLKVNLYKADGETVTIYVKPQDLNDGYGFNRIVYNPGMGADDLPTGVKCMGWVVSADGNYTAADTVNALSFDGVRNRIRTELTNGVATDGTELNFYAMLFKLYSIYYLGENGSVYDSDELLYRADVATPPAIPYTINYNYTPGETFHNFEGWLVNSDADGAHITGHSDINHNYTNSTSVTVTGDVAFKVNITEGHWLIYHENGKGATYKAADFVHAAENSVEPDPTMMLRNGYTFAGWYLGEPSEVGETPTGARFVFGGHLTENTDVYAKWTPVAEANYTVIIWKQNVECDGGYDFEEAITLSGSTDPTRPINTVVGYGSGNNKYASVNGVAKKYTGFKLRDYNEGVIVKPEGDALVNVYYDRIEYTVMFIYGRSKPNGSSWQYATKAGDNASSDYMSVSSWKSGEPPCTYSGLSNKTIGNYKYYYYPITAKYGQSIREWWPQYDYFPEFSGGRLSSWILMVGAGARGESHSVKGLVSIMDEQILGEMTSTDGNYLVARYESGTLYNWTYNVWLPKVAGVTYSGRTTRHGDVEYYLDEAIPARSGKNSITSAHRPTLLGYTGVDSVFTSGTNPVMDYFYSRNGYSITYLNGAKYDGNGNLLEDGTGTELNTDSDIAYLTDIRDKSGFRPASAPAGYVFEGWYADEPCTQLYNFNTRMPSANQTVYAKWRQIQYRVFLHPNAKFRNSEVDSTLEWGASNQALNFRITCGSNISVPTGTREDYEFVGWYTDSTFISSSAFNEKAIVLNETTVTTPYDKNIDKTDYMDKWGNVRTDLPAFNSDLTGNNGSDRFWITKKYDLYGKWRAKLPGAKGITVVYDGNGGSPATDTAYYLYQDNVKAIAPDACTPPDDTKEFSHWVMQYFAANVDSTYKDIPGSCVFPGDLFPVLRDNSKRKIINWHNPEDLEDIYGGEVNPNSIVAPVDADVHTQYAASYTVHLRAEYVDKETAPEQTSILWLMNDGSGDEVRNDTELQINKDVTTVSSIPAAPTREGYTFKGWQKYIADSGELPTIIDVDDCTPDFLYYNSEDGKYYRESTHTNEATKVAADLYNSSDYMYAVWAPDMKFSIYPICKGAQITLPSETFVGESLTGTWDATVGTISGTTYTADPNAESVTLTFTPSGSSACVHEQDTTVAVQTINIDVTDYDYIWKGGAASADDWNTASNWYVYNRANGSYSVADAVPAQAKNIYIGDYNCKANLTPSVGVDEAYANNITIAPDATLTVPDGKTLNISGNFLIEGSFVPSGTVKFVGENVTDTVTVTCADTLKFNNVVFEKDGNEDILVYNSDKGIKVNGKATFTKGIVRNDVVFDAGATANVSNHSSFVAGKVTKIANSESAETNFVFPTGSATVGQPKVLGSVKVASLPANSTTIITFHQKSNQLSDEGHGFSESEMPRWWNAADNCPENGSDNAHPRFDHVSNFEFWRVNTSSDLSATLTVSSDSPEAHFNPNSPEHNGSDIYGAIWQGGCWMNAGGVGSVTNQNTTITVRDAKIPAVTNRAGEPQCFTLGSTTHETLLPIELISFTATCDGRSAIVEWTTATERNNDYFVIERSEDAINFKEIARVAGAGNSIEPLYYSYSDYGINAGDNYYRLVQVDYDGTRTVSEIIVVNCVEPEIDAPEVQAYPNPFSGELTLELDNFGDRVTSIEVYDMLGRLVYVEQADAPQNRYETILNLSNLSKGAYNIRVSTTDFVINKNVVKN